MLKVILVTAQLPALEEKVFSGGHKYLSAFVRTLASHPEAIVTVVTVSSLPRLFGLGALHAELVTPSLFSFGRQGSPFQDPIRNAGAVAALPNVNKTQLASDLLATDDTDVEGVAARFAPDLAERVGHRAIPGLYIETDGRTVEERMVEQAAEEAAGGEASGAVVRVVVDNDDLQRRCGADFTAVLSGLVARLGRAVLLLVQNVHFLPFGCQGAPPKAPPQLLRSWQEAGGALGVSNYVADYVRQFRPRPQHSRDAFRVCCAFASAWRAFGSGPFPDVGRVVLQQWNARPRAVLMPKMMAEKGAPLLLQLAVLEPQVQFICIAGEPHAWLTVPSNVTLQPPLADPDELYSQAAIVLVPSLWQEAFGLVVVEAMLRGLPVLCSNTGGLPEAKLGSDGVLPVVPMVLPALPEPMRGRDWRNRSFPRQDVAVWHRELSALLRDRSKYQQRSEDARSRALAFVGQGELHRNEVLRFLMADGGDGAGPRPSATE